MPNQAALVEDVLAPGLRVVFCGTALGKQSSAARAYYAGRGNRFWGTLLTHLTPRLLNPSEYREVLDYGIGLTDVCKFQCGNDADLASDAFDVNSLKEKIEMHRPKVLAFNGKKAARVFFGWSTGKLSYGVQAIRVGESAVHILPSTSGSARGYWDVRYWMELANVVK